MATLLNPFLRGLDANGEAASGALLYVFAAGTTTPVTTYSDSAMTTAQAQPLVANAAGEFAGVFVPSGTYKIRVADSGAVVLYENDNVRMADRPDDLPALDDEDAVTADNTSYADGTVLFAIAESTYFEVAPSGATTYDLTNAAGEKLRYKNRHYTTPALLVASNESARGEGALWLADAFTYKEAASSATDQHLTTAGGVKLYVLLGPSGYNVMAFGAVADYDVAGGTGTDSSAAFQAALDAANSSAEYGSGPQVVFVPAGRYLIETSLDATNRTAGCTMRGEAGFKISSAKVGARIYGNTADVPVIDMIGTQHGRLENLVVTSADNAATPSTVGVYFARSTTSQYAQFCAVENCAIDMATDATANGGLGSVGICNVAAEIFTIRDTYAKGDTGLYFGSTNIYGVTSAYQTQGGPTSCSTCYFEGSTVLHSYNIVGAPLVARGAAFMNGSIYTANSSSAAGSRGFEFIGKQWGHKLRIFVEFSQRFGKCESLADCQLDILGSVTSAERYLEAGSSFNGFTNTEIKFLTTFDHTIVAPDYWLKNNAGDVCRNLKILAPAAPAVRFTVPTATSTNLLNCEFVSGTSNGNSISRTQFITRTSDYSEVPFRMGSQRFWIDDWAMLRQKSSADPTSATDGLPFLRLVNAPASATASGAPGQVARSSSYFYIYTGDGTTHSWVRTATAAW